MKKIFFLIFLNCLTFSVIAQTNISGKVIDASTGEALIGATIMYGKGQGTATDFDGNFSILIPTGERSIKVS